MATRKVILAGHEGSKKILPVSSYCLKKYLKEFDIYFLNYGEYNGRLFKGRYVKLDEEQTGGVGSWSRYISEYLKTLKDKFVVFSLDDYLLDEPIDKRKYGLLSVLVRDCARLCAMYGEYEEDKGVLRMKDNAQYSVTTQYTIWRRELLIEILELPEVKTPWDFEIEGSKYFNKMRYECLGTKKPALIYPESSALSSRWEGVKIESRHKEELTKLL